MINRVISLVVDWFKWETLNHIFFYFFFKYVTITLFMTRWPRPHVASAFFRFLPSMTCRVHHAVLGHRYIELTENNKNVWCPLMVENSNQHILCNCHGTFDVIYGKMCHFIRIAESYRSCYNADYLFCRVLNYVFCCA